MRIISLVERRTSLKVSLSEMRAGIVRWRASWYCLLTVRKRGCSVAARWLSSPSFCFECRASHDFWVDLEAAEAFSISWDAFLDE